MRSTWAPKMLTVKVSICSTRSVRNGGPVTNLFLTTAARRQPDADAIRRTGRFFRRMMGAEGGRRRIRTWWGRGAAATGGNDPQSQRLKKRYRVVAVADPRNQFRRSHASKDLMEQSRV